MYDYLIVGAGVFGATFARLMTDAGRKCLIIDRRDHIGGNCYTKVQEGIVVHKYGPHIFHCNDNEIWKFVNRYATFNNFRNAPIAISRGKVYSLPFNMYTFNQLWGVTTPDEAKTIISSQRLSLHRDPCNLEEQALSLVGRDIYETLIKEYTIKQWKRHPSELPPDIIKRLPIRFTWDNNYFNDLYQGIPVGGYTRMFENMLNGIEFRLGVDFLKNRDALSQLADIVVYTGRIDEYFDYCFGELEYRTLKFEEEMVEKENYQGNAVVNYPDLTVPWTRIVEHKHFENNASLPYTVITREIPDEWDVTKEPYYPINDSKNYHLYKKYEALASNQKKVIFGGRLAEYRYYDMHQVIASAMKKVRTLLEK